MKPKKKIPFLIAASVLTILSIYNWIDNALTLTGLFWTIPIGIGLGTLWSMWND